MKGAGVNGAGRTIHVDLFLLIRSRSLDVRSISCRRHSRLN